MFGPSNNKTFYTTNNVPLEMLKNEIKNLLIFFDKQNRKFIDNNEIESEVSQKED